VRFNSLTAIPTPLERALFRWLTIMVARLKSKISAFNPDVAIATKLSNALTCSVCHFFLPLYKSGTPYGIFEGSEAL
jgi:hypothetical protein